MRALPAILLGASTTVAHAQSTPAYMRLTLDEHELLQKGEISADAHRFGVAASLVFGFGIGQAVQGRYFETGWIFTLGEAASVAALIYGHLQRLDTCFDRATDSDVACDNHADAYIAAGIIGILAFRVWDAVDAFRGPPKHNRKVRDLRMRLGMLTHTKRLVPYFNPKPDAGGTAGFVLRF